MGSSVAERRFDAPNPTEGEGSWAADAEAEVLELLVALRPVGTRVTLAREKKRVCARALDSMRTTGSIAADTDVPVLQTTEAV